MPKVKAFGYLRVSGQRQVAGDGFPRQLAAINGYAGAHEIRIVKVFREEAVSGTVEGMDRPTWTELVSATLANGVRTILVESVGRLARDLMVQEYIIRDMEKRGITVISVYEPDLNSTDPSRIMRRQIVGAIHQYERTMIVLKLRGARQRMKAKNGPVRRCQAFRRAGRRTGHNRTHERAARFQQGFRCHRSHP